ncbi:MAG: glycosyltransferase, partial [bacterium]|nr:glycosyltransferase [bacterium]
EPWGATALQAVCFQRLFRPRPRLVLFSWEFLDLNLPWYYEAVERLSLRRADFFIAGGEAVRRRLSRQGADAEKVALLPQFGVDTEIFRTVRPGERPECFTIGFVGRLVHEKGVDLLLRACAALGGEWRLLLVGDGPEQKSLEGLAADLGIFDRVEFAGWVDHLDVPDFLRKMDVLVLPSRTTPQWAEQFGHVLIEAMSAGVVPVGSDSGEIPRVIEDGGMVFPEENAPALAASLRRLQEDTGFREALIAKGIKRVAECYSWEMIARETYAIYERILQGESSETEGTVS